jgi:hypothetical protein
LFQKQNSLRERRKERMAGETWTKDDGFLYFSFGEFDSKEYGIYRTISDRHNIELAPQMTDITADVSGGEGQYYFGTFHKSRTFTIDFAFDNLDEADLSNLKKAFQGKELKELCFSERADVVYMAKTTGTPALKVIPFDFEGETIYKGEGNIQFTAYWPYGRSKNIIEKTLSLSEGKTQNSVSVENAGDKTTTIEITSTVPVTKIEFDDGETITAENITYWNSKTGIVKNESGSIIPYNGNGVYQLPVGKIKITFTYTGNGKATIKYYEQFL